jgi:hypothetical protein
MNGMGIRIASAVLALAAGALIAGCGGSDGAETPEDAVTAFFEATVDKDSEALCDSISEESATQAAENEDVETCEEGADKAFGSEDADAEIEQFENAEVGEATVDGDTATVTVTSEGTEGEVPVVKEGDVWKVDISE